MQFFGTQTLQHGYIIAKISVLFKVLERFLQMTGPKGKLQEWHTFVAGAVAGTAIMCGDRNNYALKRQVNMAIGIRTLYALGSYCVRTGNVPLLPNNAKGYERGTDIWTFLLWGVVMWHWRHHTATAPGEMVVSQVRQMDSIYTEGDAPQPLFWMKGRRSSAMWLIASLAASNFL